VAEVTTTDSLRFYFSNLLLTSWSDNIYKGVFRRSGSNPPHQWPYTHHWKTFHWMLH